jgi:16S rRNA (guanine527-N7)-methyltransferase
VSVERLSAFPFDVISARAFAPLPRLHHVAGHIAHKSTLWLLPKGKNAANELCAMQQAWQKQAILVESLTDAEARIIVAHEQIVAVQAAKP